MIPKFRAKEKQGRWNYSDNGTENCRFSPAYAMQFFWARIDSGSYLFSTLGMATNKIVSNDNTLWQGDKIKGENLQGYIIEGTIVWDKIDSRWAIDRGETYDLLGLGCLNLSKTEIIGTIHDGEK